MNNVKSSIESNMKTVYQAAKVLQKKGYVVVPVMLTEDDKGQKKPLFDKGWQQASLSGCLDLFERARYNGLAIKTGPETNLIVIDCDVPKDKDVEDGLLDGVKYIQDQFAIHGEDQNQQLRARTANGGMHYFFSYEKSKLNGLLQLNNTTKIMIVNDNDTTQRTTIDVRGSGGCVFASPTSYGSGKSYQWMTDHIPPTADLQPCPAWMVSMLNASHKRGFSERTGSASVGTLAKRQKLDSTPFPGTRSFDFKECVPLLEQSGFINPRAVGKRAQSVHFTADNLGGRCPCCGKQHDNQKWQMSRMADTRIMVKSYSGQCSPMYLPTTVEEIVTGTNECSLASALTTFGITQTVQQGINRENLPCHIVQQHLDTCPACNRHHGCPTYEITTLVQKCWTLRNQAPGCTPRLMVEAMRGKAGNLHLQGILENPCGDVDYARLFIEEHPGLYKSDGNLVYIFKGARWEVENPLQLTTDMQSWLMDLFRKLHGFIAAEGGGWFNISDKMKENIKQWQKTIIKVNGHLKSERSSQNLLKTIKRLLLDSELHNVMDADPFLLGFNNGIFDLKDLVFRPGQPEDMVSMSVGYDFPDMVDVDTEAEVMDFIEKIYPVEEERALMQRYAGYCLLGKHNEKVMMLLSDRRSGFNAKSAMVKLMATAMGEYAVKADPNLIYRNERVRSVNDHQAGFLAYRKKRLIFVEETDPLKFLDEELLKDMNGGQTSFTVRQMWREDVITFDWISKIIIAFNEGKMPGFNIADTALVARMLTVPHRSRFYMDHVPNKPYSYKADSNIKDNYPRWAPYFLRWALEGLREYYRLRFTNLPEGCLEFKNSLIAEQDVVSQFLDTVVEEGQPTDFVQASGLFADYCREHPDMQKDKRTKKKLDTFIRTMEAKFPDAAFKHRINYTTPSGGQTTKRSVHIGIKRKPVTDDFEM